MTSVTAGEMNEVGLLSVLRLGRAKAAGSGAAAAGTPADRE